MGADYLAAEVIGMRRGRARAPRSSSPMARPSPPDTSWMRPDRGPPTWRPWPGVGLPVEARRRCVFAFEAADRPCGPPLVIDTSGAWFRREGGAFIGAIPPAAEDGPRRAAAQVDHGLFEERAVAGAGHPRPAFDAISGGRAAGPATTR